MSPAPKLALRSRVLLARTIATVAVLGLTASALSGCGSSKKIATSADPASAIPASAALYAGATVRPQGALQTEALAAGKTLTGQADPYLRLLAALQTPGAPTLDFKRDVAPWLGPRAGAYLISLRASGQLTTLLQQGLLGNSATGTFPFGKGAADGAIVLDTSDVAKARSFLEAEAHHAGAHASSYHGVSYELSAAGLAFGIIDRFAVIGSEAGIDGVIDTMRGGAALTHADGYTKLLASAPANALAHIYFNPTATGAATTTKGSSSEGLSGVLGLLSPGHQANISLIAGAGSLALDADTLTGGANATAGGLLEADPNSARALDELPGESWLAIGLGDVGKTLAEDAQGLRALGSLAEMPSGVVGVEAPAVNTLDVKSILGGMLAPLDIMGAPTAQAKREFTGWMGSAGIFASGSSLLELRAGVVIESKDPARSRAAVQALATQLRKTGATIQPASIQGTDAAVGARITGLPLIMYIADGKDSSGHTKLVLGLGEASVTTALTPPSTLASASSKSAAASSLGDGSPPSILTDFPTMLSLLEGAGLTEGSSFSKVVPYLRTLSTLSGGGHDLSGEVHRFRLVFGLQSAAG